MDDYQQYYRVVRGIQVLFIISRQELHFRLDNRYSTNEEKAYLYTKTGVKYNLNPHDDHGYFDVWERNDSEYEPGPCPIHYPGRVPTPPPEVYHDPDPTMVPPLRYNRLPMGIVTVSPEVMRTLQDDIQQSTSAGWSQEVQDWIDREKNEKETENSLERDDDRSSVDTTNESMPDLFELRSAARILYLERHGNTYQERANNPFDTPPRYNSPLRRRETEIAMEESSPSPGQQFLATPPNEYALNTSINEEPYVSIEMYRFDNEGNQSEEFQEINYEPDTSPLMENNLEELD